MGCQAVAESTVQQGLVAVPLQVQRSEILEGGCCRDRIELALPNVAPERLGDFDIGEMRDVEPEPGSAIRAAIERPWAVSSL